MERARYATVMPVSETHERSVSSVRLAAALLTHRQYDVLLQAIPWARMGRVPYGARTLGVFGRMGRAAVRKVHTGRAAVRKFPGGTQNVYTSVKIWPKNGDS